MLILLYYTLRDLIYDYGRSLLTIASLTVVVVSYLLLFSLSQAYLTFGKEDQTQNLMIISADAIDPMESTLTDEVLQTALKIAPDQIEHVFPVIFRHMNIEGQVMQVRAVPLEDIEHYNNLELLQGQWLQTEQQIVISEGVIQITTWKIGTTVNIYGSNFQVSGIVRAGGNKFASIWMTYPAGQQLFGTQKGYQMGFLVIYPNIDPETVRARLQADPRLSQQYAVYLENALGDRYQQVNQNLLTLSEIQVIISLLAITFGAYNATTLSLLEREVEMFLLRVIGFTQGKLRAILFSRAAIQTLLAYLMGWIISAAIIAFQNIHHPINIHSAPLILRMGFSSSLLGLALALTFSLLGVMIGTKQ